MITYPLPQKCSHVKIDIGLSYGANQSSSWLDQEPNLMVFGFEPNQDSVKNIKKGNIQLRHPSHAMAGKPLDKKHLDDGRMQIIAVALSNVDKKKMMSFYINSKDCGTSSLFKHDEKRLGPIEAEVQVPVISLEMFFDTFPWERFKYIDYIKIDAQGSDLNILKGAGYYLKERVVFVTAEPDGSYYFGAAECNRTNITNYMISQDFIEIDHPLTRDPTFVNRKFLSLRDKIFILQR